MICLDANVKKIQVEMETNIVPRLQIMESCYLTSYQRIQLAADKIDRMDSDVDVIKKVVTKHSEQLQKTA